VLRFTAISFGGDAAAQLSAAAFLEFAVVICDLVVFEINSFELDRFFEILQAEVSEPLTLIA